jgi:hypothetical protein
LLQSASTDESVALATFAAHGNLRFLQVSGSRKQDEEVQPTLRWVILATCWSPRRALFPIVSHWVSSCAALRERPGGGATIRCNCHFD